MERNQKIEDYMRVIYRLRENGLVRGAYIARELGVTKPTVSVALREMEAAGYLYIQPDRTVELTEKGEKIGEYVIKRYASFVRFTAVSAGDPSVISFRQPRRLIYTIQLANPNYLQNRKRGNTMPLTLAVIGEEIIIKRIGGNAEVRAHLQNLGFVSGAVVTVVSSMGGNLIVNVKNARIAISKEMAQKIFI